MKKIAIAALLLMVCAAPAFGWHRKHKDPRVVEHPKAVHEKNQHMAHRVKPKITKHHA
jgi:hypothetical protein